MSESNFRVESRRGPILAPRRTASPPIRGPSQPSARQCFQILREEPHPHDEQAEPARNPREEFVHVCVQITDPPALAVPPASTALLSTRSIALSPSTRVISVLQPAEPMSCLVLSAQPVRMPVRDTTPGNPSRGRWDNGSLRALGGPTTRERAQRMRAILPAGLNISRWLFFWPWTQLNSGYGVIDFRRAPCRLRSISCEVIARARP